MAITNEKTAGYAFLERLFGDSYYPQHLIAEGRTILLDLCERIERERPADLTALYALTAVATERFNELDRRMRDADSEIETVARDEIAVDFHFVATAYGFPEADMEELVAERDW
ncbi:DUF5713 family protein [Streptomyces qinzhouensis]|uniref:Uncharacterized protein n=1 Tax=Streptomyces qinzhouensis TaxID=2599401 RepID=A0A5B8J7W2_9ACTN|nr:DUF5713 family protein [Streptomyces qinzhouensis]QDY77346.1 hypothetical protein FQU76_13365 [Streptomyces qinzhouensis]